MTQHGFGRRGFLGAAMAAGAASALAACSDDAPAPAPSASSAGTSSTPAPGPSSGAPTSVSWGPLPRKVGALSVLAQQEGPVLALHTQAGDVRFWGGVTLEATLPGAQGGAFSATAADYRRWFTMMHDLGLRVLRLRRLHPPACYAELARHNAATPDAPLYLIQGVGLPADVQAQETFTSDAATTAMTQELKDASAAIHGDLRRAGRTTADRPAGAWTVDVSPWTAAWLIGDRWAPAVVARTDRAGRASKPARHKGRYFSATTAATATENWLAARLDELAGFEAARGVSVPLAVANTAGLDPLPHPQEPAPANTMAAIDTAHITVASGASGAWPGGTFAAYEAFPYTPAFLELQPSYANTADPYRAYLADLVAHHRATPVLVSAFGVTSALGSGAEGPLDRDQGFHREQDATKISADLLRMFADLGLAGGVLAAWHDDWTATTWNTAPRYELVAPARRPLFHDPLTADQWGGLVAHDPVRVGERVVHSAPQNGFQQVSVDHDASWLYLTLLFSGRVTSPVQIGFDILPSGGLRLPDNSGQPIYDVAVYMVPTMSTTTVYVRSALDPSRLDELPVGWWPLPKVGGWDTEALTTRRSYVVPGTTRRLSPTFLEVGTLSLGRWDPADPAYDSRATWHLERPDQTKPATLAFRLPWSMLTFADPSARTVLDLQGFDPELAGVRGMNVTVDSSTPGSPISFGLTWPVWNTVSTTERLKAGASQIRDALGDIVVPATN